MTTAFKGWFGVRREPLRYGAEQPAPVKAAAPAVQQPKPVAAKPKPAPVAKDISPLGLYHPATEAVKTWQPKGTPAQLLAHLGKHQGAMAHAEASGLHSFLEGKPSVTREEVLGHLGGGKHLAEDVIGAEGPKFTVWNDNGKMVDEFDNEEEAEEMAKRYRGGYVDRDDSKAKTHFDTYQLPGPKENYRELHVHAPDQKRIPLTANDFHVREEPVEGRERDSLAGPARKNIIITRIGGGGHRANPAEIVANANDDAKLYVDAYVNQINERDKDRVASWQDGHNEFSHVKNPVVRVRHNDRVDSEGNRVLMMEEMQGPSDANQEKMPGHLRDRVYDIGLKRMLRKAVDGGYDKLAWTTGEQQAERYNLAKHVDKLEWHPYTDTNGNQVGHLIGFKGQNRNVEKQIPESELAAQIGDHLAAKLIRDAKSDRTLPSLPEDYQVSVDRSHPNKPYTIISPGQQHGRPFAGRHATADEAKRAALEELNMMRNIPKATAEGVDLSLGGHGLKSVYDKMLPAKIGKLLKKAGGRVESTRIPVGKLHEFNNDDQPFWQVADEDGNITAGARVARSREVANELANPTVHSIRITPEIAALVKEGFSQYARDGEPERFAAHRAPAGGVSIGGKFYRGGQWLPSDEVANASPSTKAAITKGKKARVAARSSRNVDHGTVAAKLKPHAKKLSASEEQAARRSFAALKDHHGELTLHRIEELADETAKAHAQAKGSAKKTLGNRLAQLEWMAGKLAPEVKKDAPAAKAEAKPAAPAKERPTQPVDMQALDQKLRPFQSASIPLDQNDMRFAIATYHELKNEHGDTAMHHLESAANEQLAALNDLPPNAVESRRVHEKKLAAIAWQTHQLRKDGITGDVDDPRHADLTKNLDRIRMGEKAREGAHKSPWVAFLCKAIKDVGLTNEDTSIPQVFEDLKAGRFRGQPGLRKALGMLHSDFGTVTPRQLEEILPRVKSVRETL